MHTLRLLPSTSTQVVGRHITILRHKRSANSTRSVPNITTPTRRISRPHPPHPPAPRKRKQMRSVPPSKAATQCTATKQGGPASRPPNRRMKYTPPPNRPTPSPLNKIVVRAAGGLENLECPKDRWYRYDQAVSTTKRDAPPSTNDKRQTTVDG